MPAAQRDIAVVAADLDLRAFAHGGAILVDSVPGQGTTFQVTLPALRPADAAAER